MKTEASQKVAKEMMTVDQERRSALRKIAVGVGVLAGIAVLPERWTSPIIGQITLPAHAQTSGIRGIFATTAFGRLGSAEMHKPENSIVEAVGNFLVTNAQATSAPIGPNFVCVSLAGNTANVVLGWIDAIALSGTYTGSGTVSGGATVSAGIYTFNVAFISTSATSVSVEITASGYLGNFTLTPTSSCSSFT
jgi:hypothetical protein